MEQHYQMLQKQKQILTHQQIQSLEILTMDNVELEAFLQSEYLENPMLEHTDGTGESALFSNAVQPSSEDGKWNQKIEESVDLREYLKSQLKIGIDDKNTIRIKTYLIECIEDSGYFTMPVEEMAVQCGASVGEIRKCLEELKQLEPIGVFSADLEECLLYQVKSMKIELPELENIIAHHLEDLADGNIGKISRLLHISTAQVRKCALLISTLNPRPARGFGTRDTEYIVPDIIVRKEEKWEIILNDSWIGNYQICDCYLRMMEETQDKELKRYFQEKAQRVRYIMKNVEQRRETLLNLANLIVDFQNDYLEDCGNLKPMTMADAAEKMEVHPSTISRAVKGKYIQFPKKTVLLKDMFSAAVVKNGTKEEMNAQEIKDMICKWIENENKAKPYSDQKLKEMLDEKGIPISRRAVAKYREALGIRGSFERKEMKESL